MSNMGSIEQGARQMVEVCLDVKPNEKVIVVSERGKSSIVDAILGVALEITDCAKVLYLDDFGARPLAKIPDAVSQAVRSSDVFMMILDKMDGEFSTVRCPLKEIGLKHSRTVICPNLNEEIMCTGMSVDHVAVREFTRQVFDFIKGCKTMRVVTSLGTDLVFSFRPEYAWLRSDGDYRKRPQTGTNLPGAEIFTYPSNVNGVAIVDGIIGDLFTSKYGFLDKTPLKMIIKDGRVQDIDCLNAELKDEFARYVFESDENSSKIGEIGIGTNKFIDKLIGVMLQDEKYPGVHIAVGHGYPKWTGAPYDSSVHCDCVIKGATISVDGVILMKDGIYSI